MKKIIAMVLTMALVMSANVGAFAHYETEEVPVELINRLIDEGFSRSDEDPDVWEFESYEAWTTNVYEYYYMYAKFDTYFNEGYVLAFAYDGMPGHTTGEQIYAAVRWDNLIEDFVSLNEYVCD